MLPMDSRVDQPTLPVAGAVLYLTCNIGSVPEGDPKMECKDNGEWTAPKLICRSKINQDNKESFTMKFMYKAFNKFEHFRYQQFLLISKQAYANFKTALT